jgi:dolichol-phosphate mannosyltransferase
MIDERERRPRISLMIPCYNEQEILTHEMNSVIEDLAKDPDFDFEVLFIDDHSSDDTPRLLKGLCQRHPGVRAIRLARNCGSHMAYRAGLDFCKGDAVAFAVADMQEGIELIRQSLQLWRAGAPVVGTIAIGRDRGGLVNELGARLFYWARYQLGGSTSREAALAALRVIDREVVEHCKRFAPRIRNLNSWVFGQPFSAQFLRYTPSQRHYGSSKWTFRRKAQLAIDTMLDGSAIFLTIWLPIGAVLLATGIGTLLAGLVRIAWNGGNAEFSGALQIGTMLSCTGLILIAMGTMGTYLWRILQELRGGPGYAAQSLTRDADRSPVEEIRD